MWMQNLLVALIVTAAALFAVWRLPGNATRLRYAAWLKKLGGGGGILHALGLRLEARVMRAMAASGCANCGSAGEHRR